MPNSTLEGFRLSPQQKNLWLLQQSIAAPSYPAVCAVLIDAELDKNALRQVVEEIAGHHEILRTTFQRPTAVKTPFQIVREQTSLSWNPLDLSELNANQQKAKVDEIFERERRRSFDLDQGPLLRVVVLKLRTHCHLMILSLPCLCADPRTLINLVSMISAGLGGINHLPPSGEPMQYADFAEWQNELLEAAADEHVAQGKEFAKTLQAALISGPTLPLEKRARSSLEFEPAVVSVSITPDLASQIANVAATNKVSVPALLFASWQGFLERMSLQDELVVFHLFDGRKLEDLQDALGPYAKYLPLNSRCKGRSFAEYLAQAKTDIDEAAEWQEYFDPVSTEAGFIHQAIGFDFEEYPVKRTLSGLSFSLERLYVGLSPFKIKLSCLKSEDTLQAELQFNSQILERETVEQYARYFENLLAAVLQNPTAGISEIELLSNSERQQLLIEPNQTAVQYPDSKSVHELFESQVERSPAAIAVICGARELSYAELNTRANQLAHYLRRHGVGPDVCVGLCVERSAEMIVALLGILKAGGAYVPLNPDQPKQRLELQLAESGATVCVTKGRRIAELLDFKGETIDLERHGDLLQKEPTNNPQQTTDGEHLAYVIYTSGSTGVPKGVGVRHRNLLNYTQFIIRRLGLDHPVSFATVSTISADLGNTCIFPSLVSGGCLHIIDYDVSMDGNLFSQYVSQHRIDVLKIVPSHFQALLESSEDGRIFPSKYLILGGEGLSLDLADRISKKPHTCEIINHYGPTETTVGSLTFSLDKSKIPPHALTVPIGQPIANTRVYVLDQQLRPLPRGWAGELFIGGAGVAVGYLNQSEATALQFVPDPFSADPDARLYRTGDLARYLPDGNFEFLGRLDHQVKIRGHRVELGEIEASITQHPHIRQSVVMVQRDTPGDAKLIAYVVTSTPQTLGLEELRKFLKDKLPDYMIPAAFVHLGSLPLTPNGKIDRARLPSPDELHPEKGKTFVAPRNEVETEVAGIWASVLKLEAVGIHDNFFDLGGHSLLATQVISRMRKSLQMEIPLRSLFESPTVAQLAERIGGTTQEATADLLAELEALSDEEAERLLEVERERTR